MPTRAIRRQTTTTLGAGGRVVIPTDYRKALNLEPGDEVMVTLEAEGVRIMSVAHAVSRAQALVRPYVGAGRSLSEELIAERREESDGA